ncbi:hypothetical protein B0H34DRAFT_770904 [Crassisporium funariophilum]|nr:hypothetical protein B0H34DRAFT_770904 [Crassisporium funariophilum]
MASLIGKRVFTGIRCHVAPARLPVYRIIHSTAMVQKKKSKVVIEDLFGEDAFAEPDLVKEEVKEAASPTPQLQPEASTEAGKASGSKTKVKATLEPKERLARFNKQIAFMTPRLGRKPSVKTSKVRKNTWLTALQLASTEEQMRELVGLLPLWKEMGIQLKPYFAEKFVRRCQEIGCQPLALEVFGNFAKYNVALTLGAAQYLIHSLHVLYPMNDLLVAASLFPVYNLPPISDDLVCASMFAAACIKHDTPQSRQVVEMLLPHIKTMLEKVDLSQAASLESKQKNKWVSWSLRKVNKAVTKQTGSPFVRPEQIPIDISVTGTVAQP